MTIVIAGRHGQEQISLRMLLTSEPLSCTMPSSSVCHANPLHVIMGVYMPHRQQPSQGHAISRGKSMTHHIACHFQGRQCPCASSLACSGQGRQCPCASSLACSGQRRLCSCADSLVGIRDGNIITFIFGFLACADSLVGIRPADSSAGSVASKRCRIF